jgi:hypothetical protein
MGDKENYQYVFKETTVTPLFWDMLQDSDATEEMEHGCERKQKVLELRDKLVARILWLAEYKLNKIPGEMVRLRVMGVKVTDIAIAYGVAQPRVTEILYPAYAKLQKLAFDDDECCEIMHEMETLGGFDVAIAKRFVNLKCRTNRVRARKAREKKRAERELRGKD